MMSQVKNRIVFSVFFAVLFAQGLLWAEDPATQKLTKITIAEYGEFPLYVSLYVADAKGFFRKQGLDVTIVPAGGDEKVFAALLAGDAQFGVSDPIFVAISGEKGQPGKVVASLIQNVPQWGVTTNPKIPSINSPAELKGYSVATYPAPSTSYTLQKRMFLAGGLTPNIHEMPYGSLGAALQAGAVDIAVEFEFNVLPLLKSGARKVYAMSDYYPELAVTGLTTLPSYIETHPENVQAMVNAFQLATNYIYSDLAGASEVIARRFPNFTQAEITQTLQSVLNIKTLPRDGILTTRGWQEAVKLRTEVGDLKKPAPYEQYVVTRFAEQAKNIK